VGGGEMKGVKIGVWRVTFGREYHMPLGYRHVWKETSGGSGERKDVGGVSQSQQVPAIASWEGGSAMSKTLATSGATLREIPSPDHGVGSGAA